MQLLQVTNIVSHHQLPLARRFASAVGEKNFRFAATQESMPERQKLGWRSEDTEPWILRAGANESDFKQFLQWWINADVVICGDRLIERLNNRIDKKKLTFYMTERWWKPPFGMARLFHPMFILMAAQFRKLASSAYFNCLPIGHYSAVDMKRIAPFRNRMWLWGYFTEVLDVLPECDRSENDFKVLWAGRMLSWKKVNTLIKAFTVLLSVHPYAMLTLVGDGPERRRLELLAERLLPIKNYTFLPSKPVIEIRQLMRQHHIYVLSSNAQEGWGAVINEAMSEGCTIIASEHAGAAKTLIRHGENGLIFKPKDWKALGHLLSFAASDKSKRIQLARRGQQTIANDWSPAVAAERFLSICGALLNKRAIPKYSDGPMSAV